MGKIYKNLTLILAIVASGETMEVEPALSKRKASPLTQEESKNPEGKRARTAFVITDEGKDQIQKVIGKMTQAHEIFQCNMDCQELLRVLKSSSSLPEIMGDSF